MKSKIVPFIVGFSIYSGIIVLISIAIQLWITSIVISPMWPIIFIFLYLFTLLATTMLFKYIDSRISQFANAFMLVNFGKLVIFTIVIVLYAWFFRAEAISFTLTFFVYYLLLNIYEIVGLLKMQKNNGNDS